MEDPEFAIYMTMFPSLACVSKNEVCDCFTSLMDEFLQSAIEFTNYFEKTYIGRKLPDQTRKVPPFLFHHATLNCYIIVSFTLIRLKFIIDIV